MDHRKINKNWLSFKSIDTLTISMLDQTLILLRIKLVIILSLSRYDC